MNMPGPMQLRVLRAMTVGLDSVTGLQVSLNADEDDVRRALAQLVDSGLVGHAGTDAGAGFSPTKSGAELGRTDGLLDVSTGKFGSTSLNVSFRVGHTPAEPTWTEVGNVVAQAWSVARTARTDETKLRDETLLISDEERESAVQGLSTAYGEGRMTLEEHDRRTDLVLHAKNRGDLDHVFSDLPDTPPTDGTAAPWITRKVVFGVVALLTVPFLLLAVLMMTAENGGLGGVGLGAGLLVVLLPGLLALGWWAFGGHEQGERHTRWQP